MKGLIFAVLNSTALCALAGCAVGGSVVSKSTTGNLEINVIAPEGVDAAQTRLFIDGAFIGNVSERRPVLYVRRGERVLRAELAGFPAIEEKFLILGEPNHQTWNVVFRSP
jgi:hypothetical protein